jgi:hypothetical protein
VAARKMLFMMLLCDVVICGSYFFIFIPADISICMPGC